jgi:uncharacterized 2Fe-2S/4Fe-4S cluster protein (DUF4445 family)
MTSFNVAFLPADRIAGVESGTTVLEAAAQAGIVLNNVCGGDGICGRCKMIVKQGKVQGGATALLTREEVQRGVILACLSYIESDLVIEIPEETRAIDRLELDEQAQRFRALHPGITRRQYANAPLVTKAFLKLDPPTLDSNFADCQRLQQKIKEVTKITSMQLGLKTLRRLPQVLRDNNFEVTATIGTRRDIAEVMEIEAGETSDCNFMIIVDLGTSTVVAHLVDTVRLTTTDAAACFNSQAVYGREVTARIMAAEKKGTEPLQTAVLKDINGLISSLAVRNGVQLRDINAIVCSGNTTMMHLMLALPSGNIRRTPYISASTEPPPFRAAEVGIKINPRGIIFCIPAISSWVGGDITSGILATGLHERSDTAMLIDIGTNGEIVIGNNEWLVSCSASTGPALEGAGVEYGMIAENGAIESVYIEDDEIRYKVIGNTEPEGLCGSGIIDLVAVLLEKGIIDRSGRFISKEHKNDGFVLATNSEKDKAITVTEDDLESVITAKAAVFAAIKIMLDRLSLKTSDLTAIFLAGGFGNYINRKNAIKIGLLPDLPVSSIHYVGNTSIWGAKLAAFSCEAYDAVRDISARTTYYDLMGTPDYVEQFKQAMFLPHTDIELFPSLMQGNR